MPQRTALDPLICQVDRRDHPHNKTSQRVVSVLLNPGRSLLEFKKEAFYLVSHYRGGDCGATFTATVEDFARGWRLELQVEYKVRCGEGSFSQLANRLAEQLYDPAGPQAKLESLIRSWIEHFVSQIGGPAEFLLKFYTHRDPLTQAIRNWAREQLGLDVRPTISLLTDAIVKETIEIPASVSKVICRDYDKEIELQVGPLALDLDPSPQKAIYAHIRQRDAGKLGDVIEKAIRETVRSTFNLQQLRREVLHIEVQPKLKSALNLALGEYGRTVRALELKCDSALLKAESSYTSPEFVFKAKVPDYTREATVECYLQMSLANLGLFATQNIESPPDDWARAALQSLVVSRLSRHTYVELMKEWENVKRSINDELKVQAASIGYEWKHTFIKTDLPFDVACRLQEMVVHEKQLTTMNSKSRVTLEGKIEYRIVDLKTLARKHASETNINARVEECIRGVLQQFAGRHAPKVWNLNFDSNPGGRALKEYLFDEINQRVYEEFGARVESLALRPDGELMRVLDSLREQAPILSSVDRDGVCTHPEFRVTRADYPVELSYRVLDVSEDFWHRFEMTKPSIDEVSRRVILHTKQILADDDPVQFARLSNNDVLRRLNGDEVFPALREWIRGQFGLEIYVDHWVREKTEIETESDGSRVKLQKAALGIQTEFLEDLALRRQEKDKIRAKILEYSVNPELYGEEIATLKSRLTQLDKEISDLAAPEKLRGILADQTEKATNDLGRSLGSDRPRVLGPAPGDDQGEQQPD